MTYDDFCDLIPILKIKSRIKENGCWVYTGFSVNSDGHARISFNGKKIYLHRLAFCLENNLDYFDKSFQANHKPECYNPACFNPNHLYRGLHIDNMEDRTNRITHCPKGHEFNEENPKHNKGCRICYKIYIKQYYQDHKDKWNK